MMIKKIYFPNSSGKKLCGILSTVKNETAVLICHGLGGNKEKKLFKSLQEEINVYGFTTLRIDLLGHGESQGNYNDLTLTETIDDILQAIKKLESEGYKNIGFIGSSFGGVGGIMATTSTKFKFLILISPPTYYGKKDVIKTGIYLIKKLIQVNKKDSERADARLSIKFFRDYGSHDSYEVAKKITAPTLIIQGDKDKIVPVLRTKELKKNIKNSELIILEGVDHEYKNVKNKVVSEVMNFIIKQN